MTDSTSSPSPLSRGQGMELKVAASIGVVGSPGHQSLSLGSYHLGHSKSFRSSVSEMEDQI